MGKETQPAPATRRSLDLLPVTRCPLHFSCSSEHLTCSLFSEHEATHLIRMFFHPAPPSRRCLAAVFLDVTPILLLDEVLAVGDFVFAEKCFAHFEECRKKVEQSFLLRMIHLPWSALPTGRLLIHQSRLEAIGDPHEVLQTYHALG